MPKEPESKAPESAGGGEPSLTDRIVRLRDNLIEYEAALSRARFAFEEAWLFAEPDTSDTHRGSVVGIRQRFDTKAAPALAELNALASAISVDIRDKNVVAALLDGNSEALQDDLPRLTLRRKSPSGGFETFEEPCSAPTFTEECFRVLMDRHKRAYKKRFEGPLRLTESRAEAFQHIDEIPWPIKVAGKVKRECERGIRVAEKEWFTPGMVEGLYLRMRDALPQERPGLKEFLSPVLTAKKKVFEAYHGREIRTSGAGRATVLHPIDSVKWIDRERSGLIGKAERMLAKRSESNSAADDLHPVPKEKF